MSDLDHEAEFEKQFEGFGEDPKPAEPPKADDGTTPPAPATPPKEGEDNANKNQPTGTQPEGDAKPGDQKLPAPEGDKPAGEGEAGKPGEGKPADGTPTPTPPEQPKPLTKEDVTSIIRDIQTGERASTRQVQETTQEVLEAYYPDGLSNVLIDQASGRELRTPQDVVDASNGEMDIEEAAQWLMNEQYKIDSEVNKIKDDARKIAETTINFKADSIAALQKYEPLFKWQPSLQSKVWNILQSQVKADMEKGVILSAPDVMEFYDTYLEPYQKAYEFSQGQPATNPNPPAPEPPKPGTEDRLDEGGDGEPGGEPDDPDNFAQQTVKELAKGI